MVSDTVRTAQAHLAAGRLEQARALLSRALARDPAAAAEMDLLAATLMRMGRMDQARFYAERACALRPGDPAALFNLGKLLLHIGQSAPGIECLEKALTLEPDERSTFSALTNALIVGRRTPSTDKKVSLNQALRDFEVQV